MENFCVCMLCVCYSMTYMCMGGEERDKEKERKENLCVKRKIEKEENRKEG